MPFEEVMPVFASGGSRGADAVRFGVRRSKLGKCCGIVSLPPAALTALGWGKGDRLKLLVGSGPDHGVIRLEKAAAGQIVLAAVPKGNALMARLGDFPALPKASLRARPVVHEVRAGGIDIDLPAVEEAAPRQAPRPPHPLLAGTPARK